MLKFGYERVLISIKCEEIVYIFKGIIRLVYRNKRLLYQSSLSQDASVIFIVIFLAQKALTPFRWYVIAAFVWKGNDIHI